MRKIKHIDDLQEYVLNTLEDLSRNKIEIEKASCIAKLSETTISGLKTMLEYARLTNQQPNIKFLDNSIKGEIIKPKLELKKTK